MANSDKNSGLWKWIIGGILTAAAVIGILFYIGWFDRNTHVDTPAGDNVEQQYTLQEANADAPGEADWQNADHESLDELITHPEAQNE